jgi:protein-S-isoprenylcysteine O-methyltransferase Ste14
MSALTGYLSHDFLGGPRLLRFNWVINLQKGGTAPFVAFLMWWYGNTSTVAWVYLALHGTYGLCWILKDLAFPDRRWRARITVGGGLMAILLVLGPYWVAPWLLVSGALGAPRTPPADALLAAAIALHTFGLALMLGADAQKYFTLRLRPGLITDGLFARVRHPNYLGEMMIYGSYALLVRHWLPWVILAWVWTAVFLVNIRMAEASLSRYAEWDGYAQRTGALWPRLRLPVPTDTPTDGR